eukprot:Gregarina_sp_Poly_1__2669@NODE_1730_length_3447_cov_648_274260_g1131_i0_p2_GENE_NODE_1730_length_3447_cov_648_274260_g1131_i0NODE_1730_length_3447_cov_648_274260_g1131_i0_p2_ORF_typecomplete_len108_score3_91_NODE_1730_length_3447_cov_648_274260_g1131_i011421465
MFLACPFNYVRIINELSQASDKIVPTSKTIQVWSISINAIKNESPGSRPDWSVEVATIVISNQTFYRFLIPQFVCFPQLGSYHQGLLARNRSSRNELHAPFTTASNH